MISKFEPDEGWTLRESRLAQKLNEIIDTVNGGPEKPGLEPVSSYLQDIRWKPVPKCECPDKYCDTHMRKPDPCEHTWINSKTDRSMIECIRCGDILPATEEEIKLSSVAADKDSPTPDAAPSINISAQDSTSAPGVGTGNPEAILKKRYPELDPRPCECDEMERPHFHAEILPHEAYKIIKAQKQVMDRQAREIKELKATNRGLWVVINDTSKTHVENRDKINELKFENKYSKDTLEKFKDLSLQLNKLWRSR